MNQIQMQTRGRVKKSEHFADIKSGRSLTSPPFRAYRVSIYRPPFPPQLSNYGAHNAAAMRRDAAATAAATPTAAMHHCRPRGKWEFKARKERERNRIRTHN